MLGWEIQQMYISEHRLGLVPKDKLSVYKDILHTALLQPPPALYPF